MRIFHTFAAITLTLLATPVAAQSIGGVQGAIFADPLTINAASGTTAVPQNTAGGAYGMEVEGITCVYADFTNPLAPYTANNPPLVSLLVLHNGTANFITKLYIGIAASGTYFPFSNMILTTGTYAPFADLPTDANDGHLFFPVGPGDKIELQSQIALTGASQMRCTVWGKTFN